MGIDIIDTRPSLIYRTQSTKLIYINNHLLQPVSKPTVLMKKVFASIGDSVSPMTLCGRTCASTEAQPRRPKIRLINVVFLRTLSEIKLKRTDTTLDLSQKAKRAGEEKKKVGRAAGIAQYLYVEERVRAR